MAGTCVALESWPELNDGMVYTDHVKGRSAAGCSLLQFYAARHAHSGSVGDWRQRIAAGQVRVNGAVCQDPEAPVPPNSLLEYHRPPWREPPAPCRLGILHQDSHLLVVDKPAGLQVLPCGPFHQRCVLTLLRHHYQQHADQLAGLPAPVHRLGRGTSGVLVCACSEEARRALSRAFEEKGAAGLAASGDWAAAAAGSSGRDGSGSSSSTEPDSCNSGGRSGSARAAAGSSGSGGEGGEAGRGEESEKALPAVAAGGGSMHKIYRALVQGIIPADEGEVSAPIGLLPYPGVRGGLFAACAAGSSGAKPALSRFRVVRRDAAAQQTVVEVEIFTGRPHQIRIHMAAAGHPLVGDPLYGPGGVPRLAAGGASSPAALEGGGSCEGAAPGDARAAGGCESGAAVQQEKEGGADAQVDRGGACAGVEPGVAEELSGAAVVVPGDCGYLLHCMVMEFSHPIMQQRLRICCPPPPELADAAG